MPKCVAKRTTQQPQQQQEQHTINIQ